MAAAESVSVVTKAPTEKAVLLFWAPWHEDSVRLKDTVLPALAANSSSIKFGAVEAEEQVELSETFGVTVVPTFVFCGSDGKIVEKMEGIVEVAQVTQAVQRLKNSTSASVAPAVVLTSSVALSPTIPLPPPAALVTQRDKEESLNDRLKQLVSSSEVMLFMKGSPDGPKCGFSRQAVEILQDEAIVFDSFDILTDEDVRQGLKKYSDWPTYPQLYVRGEFMGGLDILKEIKEESTLKEALELETLDDRLAKLVKRDRIMLFMKGLPSAPRCGFSRQIVELLEEEGIAFDSFNILEDNDVRQGLKKFSDWPTYPQLYVDGDLVGGLDIVKEMRESGELSELLVDNNSCV